MTYKIIHIRNKRNSQVLLFTFISQSIIKLHFKIRIFKTVFTLSLMKRTREERDVGVLWTVKIILGTLTFFRSEDPNKGLKHLEN